MSGVNMTEVRLLNVPLKNDYLNTAWFSDVSSQTSYFNEHKVDTSTEFSYQRKDKAIRYPEHIDSLYSKGVNYVMYRNSYYSDKWFYAFITDMEYINDNNTLIHIETDVIQTWLFDYDVKESFVEREHVNDDTVGLHVIEEGLQLSEYIANKHTVSGFVNDSINIEDDNYRDNDLIIIVGVTEYYDDTAEKWLPTVNVDYTNVPSSIAYYGFTQTVSGSEALNSFIEQYAEGGKSDSIVCMFLVPKRLVTINGDDGRVITSIKGVVDFGINQYSSDSAINLNRTITSNVLDGYTPHNNKLLCYPFRYLLVNNNSGSSVTYNFEDFDGLTFGGIKQPQFVVNACLTPGCSIRMIPLNYKGCAFNDIEGINLGKFPMLNWTTDLYTNWLTQNGVNIATSVLASAGSVVVGAVTGNPLAIGGGIVALANSVGEIHKMQTVPNQAEGNINCGDVVTASGSNEFHFYDMSIKKSCAEFIDEYFDIYGYKVNRVKLPNKNHRLRYWYTKTVNVDIRGKIPNNDLNKIKECYNNGITFWRNGNITSYSSYIRESNIIETVTS